MDQLNPVKPPIQWSDFQKLDMRVGTIIDVQVFKEARKPAYILQIDFGDLGIKKSSAQITKRYSPQELKGTQVIAIINFPPKQIGPIQSECLVLGAVGDEGDVVILSPNQPIYNGAEIG